MYKFKNINHITIVVGDKGRSKQFYCDKLGFEYTLAAGKHLWLRIGEEYIHVSEDKNKPVVNSFYHFAVNVDGFYSYKKYLIENDIAIFNFDERESKVPVTLESKESHFFLYDPDHNLVEFVDALNSFFNPNGS